MNSFTLDYKSVIDSAATLRRRIHHNVPKEEATNKATVDGSGIVERLMLSIHASCEKLPLGVVNRNKVMSIPAVKPPVG